ncbi:HD domain-containing protein 2 [Lamellibrachia satsuma]|nr:HD domain-containing protein 2 [Lamellibrachia satsuma]
MMLIGKLKSTVRTGWGMCGVKKAESVADHMYRMAVLAFLANSKTQLNKDRCIKLTLVHDMAECIVGDIVPSDGVSKEEKHRREMTAMEHLCKLTGEETGREIYDLWKEYEDQATPEACFVKDLDRFDMVLQAYEYEVHNERAGQLQDFFNSTQGKFQHPTVRDWVQELYMLRQQHIEKTIAAPADGQTK